MTRILSVLFLAAFFFGGTAQAQVKIGYTNVELVLAYMPQSKAVNQQLETYDRKLQEQLEAKQKYAQAKYEELLEKEQKNLLSPEQKEAGLAELEKLQKEIQDFAVKADEQSLAKREELLVPVLEQLQNAIEGVAKDNGYTYILNQTTSSGVSTILYGPEENDITELVFKKLGIPMPTQSAPAPAPGGSK